MFNDLELPENETSSEFDECYLLDEYFDDEFFGDDFDVEDLVDDY